MKSEIVIGRLVPDFSLVDADGDDVKLSEFRGRLVVIYFYPKDDTPGCTLQACEFRDTFEELAERGIVVLGISPDSQESHKRFRDKYELPFYLLSDTDKTVCQMFGVLQEKNMYGKVILGVKRSTFIVDGQGVLRFSMRNVKPEGHVAQVVSLLGELAG